ncbi:hypothetical protein R80B4_02365 [Fibrobacteres bacterium R8-0-B4]
MVSLKVRVETDDIRRIINNRRRGGYVIIGSFVVESEIAQIPDDEKRRIAEQDYKESIDDTIRASALIITRAQKLESMGLRPMDARHLAAAESVEADFLLTVDTDFIKKCNNFNLTTVMVMNPTNFVKGGYLK